MDEKDIPEIPQKLQESFSSRVSSLVTTLKSKRTVLILGAAALLLVGLGAGYIFSRPLSPPPTADQEQMGVNPFEGVQPPFQPNQATPPKLEKFAEHTIAGASLWLFAVDDGSQQLVVSAEQDQEVMLGRLDPNNPAQPVDWQVVISKIDTGGRGTADHWHIFAHGLHWIVFSVPGDDISKLATFDKNFNRTNLVDIDNPGNVPTNDMFLVEEKDGVAVGHFLPGTGHKVFQFDTNANLKGTVDVGGGQYIHTNGSSAEKTSDGFIIFGTETLAPDSVGGIKKIVTDSDWKPKSSVNLVREEGKNIVMASSATFENGYRVVHARVRDGAKPFDPRSAPSAPAPGQPLPDDSGAIVRYVIAPDNRVVSQETLASQGANRPHTALVGDLLITSWDSKSGVKLRIDKVSF